FQKKIDVLMTVFADEIFEFFEIVFELRVCNCKGLLIRVVFFLGCLSVLFIFWRCALYIGLFVGCIFNVALL
ncbi:hypothetical protein ABY52_02155, partial [Klebsiella pneumoniae]